MLFVLAQVLALFVPVLFVHVRVVVRARVVCTCVFYICVALVFLCTHWAAKPCVKRRLQHTRSKDDKQNPKTPVSLFM